MKYKKYVVISDIHVPYHDQKAADALCDFIKDFQPEGFVINGDYLDFIELSSFSASSVASLENLRVADTFGAGNALLNQYEKALGKKVKEKYFLSGNHEDRVRRWAEKGDNAVWLGHDALDVDKQLNLKKRGFKYIEAYPEGHIRLGKLIVTHGRWSGQNPAARHVNSYRHSVMLGHVHTPGMHYASAFGHPQAGYVTGHMADANSKALSYAPQPNSWCQGFGVVYVRDNGEFNAQLVNFWNGVFFYGGKAYGKKGKK